MTHDPPATFRQLTDRCPTCGAGPDELHDPRAHDPAFDERMHVAVSRLTEMELLKIIAVYAARLVWRMETPPTVNGARAIEVELRGLHQALDRLDEFKRQQRGDDDA